MTCIDPPSITHELRGMMVFKLFLYICMCCGIDVVSVNIYYFHTCVSTRPTMY